MSKRYAQYQRVNARPTTMSSTQAGGILIFVIGPLLALTGLLSFEPLSERQPGVYVSCSNGPDEHYSVEEWDSMPAPQPCHLWDGKNHVESVEVVEP